MSIARKILWNTMSQIIGKGFIAVIGIVTVKMLTWYLGKEGYGQYTTAFEFLAFFSIVADLGLYTIGVREMAKDEKKIPMIVGNILSIRTILCFLMVGIGIVAAFLTPQYKDTFIPFGVVLVGIALSLNILTSTVSTVLQVHLKMEYNSLASVIGKIVSVSYMAAVIFVFYPVTIGADATAATTATAGAALRRISEIDPAGFYQLIWAGIVGNFFMLFITWLYSRRYAKIAYRLDKEFIKDVLLKALPYGIALVLNTIYFRIGSVLLSLIKGPADVGVYGVPMRMLEAVGIIPLYFMNAVLPVLTRSLNRKDGSQQKIIQYAFDFLVMGSMPIVAGAVVLAYPITYLISSPEFLSNLSTGFYGSDMVLQILIFALAFSFINSLFGFILVADNRQMKLLTRNAVGAALTIILDLLLIPAFGVRGAAFTNVITELYVAIASYMIARHYIKFKISLKTSAKIMLSALVMAVCIHYLRDFTYTYIQNKNLFLLVPAGAAIYLAMLLLTKTITKEMFAMIRKPKPQAEQLENPPA
jgi:O-antigen/teichoic acid export membrane protein